MILIPLALATIHSNFQFLINISTVFFALIPKNWAKFVVFLLLVIQVFLSTNQVIVNQIKTPLGYQYTTDMRAFLKTVQLMESGKDFYFSFFEGMAGLRNGSFQPDINAWRQPFIFYGWKTIGSDRIYFVWQILLVVTLISSFLITKNIWSSLILWPYLHYSLNDLTILQPEWWGMVFLIIGLASHTQKKYSWAIFSFLLSFLCRELYVIPIFFVTLANFKKYFSFYILAFIFYSYHLFNIFKFDTAIVRPYSNGNWKTLHSIFAYGSWEYLIGIYRPLLLLFVLTTVSFFINRKNSTLFFTYFTFFIFATTMAVFGKIDNTRDYWSIYFIPVLLVSSPAIIFPSKK